MTQLKWAITKCPQTRQLNITGTLDNFITRQLHHQIKALRRINNNKEHKQGIKHKGHILCKNP